MNRRLVLIDQEETPNVAGFYGIGLGNEIYTLQTLREMDQEILRQSMMSLGPSDGVMLVGSEPFKFIQEYFHAGIRSENYFDCAKLDRLSFDGGFYAKVVIDPPTPNEVNYFMSQEFTQDVDFSWFKSKVISDFEGAMRFLEYLDSLPENTDYGFDYEASGMPLDKWFEISGASLCTTQYGGFISFTDIRHTNTLENYQTLLIRLGDFLTKRMSHIWTYNMQYEFQVSHRMLRTSNGKMPDLYNLCDASVVNVLDGHHMKKYSLKWTAQRVLKAKVWDTAFDKISDLIDSMLFIEEGKLKNDKHKVLKVTKNNFTETPEWKELISLYPNHETEFKNLILEYWGNAFMCIPSDILGYYCNLDAFYTLMIYKVKEKEYKPEAFSVFNDNIRLACRLHSCGIPKDELFREGYEKYCKEQEAWGITYCAEARCWIKMKEHSQKMANIKKYNPIAIKLLKENRFYNGNPIEITKDILLKNIDTMDAYELGVNEGSLLMDFGPEFAEGFIEKTREAMEECEFIKTYKKTGQKVIKQKIDASVKGKKKILGVLGEKIKPLIGLDKIVLNNKHIELEKYMYYERAYNELMEVSKNQLNDINNIPNEITAFGKKWSLQNYSSYVADNYFKSRSPEENDKICYEFAKLYPTESAYLAAILESTQQLNGAEKFYENLGIKTVEDGYNHFMNEWQKYCNGIPADQTAYPEKMYTLSLQYYNELMGDQIKEIWSNFNGYNAQAMFFSYVNDQYLDYCNIFNPQDLNNNFYFMRKLVLHYLLSKKYSKLLSTYIGCYDEGKEKNIGMFLGEDIWVLEDPENHVMIQEVDKNEPGAICKMRPHFQCMEKSSKRWSKIMAVYKGNFIND